MALPFIFATEGGNQASSQLDANYNAVAAMACVSCTAAGTNSILLTPQASQPNVSAYANYQLFSFKAPSTSSGSVSLNVNSVGAQNLYLPGGVTQATTGNIVSGYFYIVAYDSALNSGVGGFVIVSNNITGTPSTITNSLGSDVALNNTSNYFDGPSVAQGSSGTWMVFGSVVLQDTAGSAGYQVKLWDGTTVIASCDISAGSASSHVVPALSGVLASPAGNLRISVKDSSSTSGKILFNASGNSKDSTITAVRVFGT